MKAREELERRVLVLLSADCTTAERARLTVFRALNSPQHFDR